MMNDELRASCLSIHHSSFIIHHFILMADKDEKGRPLGRDAYERETTTDLKDTTHDKPKGWPLHTRILIGLLAGVVAGVAANRIWGGDHASVAWTISRITEPIGTLFLRLLLMIVVPLVFSSLVVGVAGIGDIRRLGRVGLKAFAYCLVISACSVVIGLAVANTIRPGQRVDPATRDGLEARYGSDAAKQVADATKKPAASESAMMQVVKTLVPAN